MTERYKLELYIIRDNELEFALYDKEAENSQGTTKMIEKKLNWQDERITELETKLNELALEFLNYDIITMGKAVEISEMSNHDFRQYTNKNKEG